MVPRYTENRQIFRIGMLVLVSVIVFCNSFQNDFIWDDTFLISDNLYIRDCKNIPVFFTPRYWNEIHPFPGQYRPLRTVSFALDYCFWKLNPTGYHTTNVLVHAINVVLVFYLVFFIAGERTVGHKTAAVYRSFFLSVPFLTALFFATHPIHTESILFTKNRSELLAFLFFLLSFLLFIKHHIATRRMVRILMIIGAWFCFTAALLSKETALTLPGVLVLYIICFYTGQERKNALIRVVPYAVTVFVYFWFMHSFIKPADALTASGQMPSGIGQHALTVIKTAGWYFKMLALPFPLKVEYVFTLPESVLAPSVLVSLLMLLFLFGGAVRAYQRSRTVFFAVGWIVLTLLPAVNMVYLASRPIAEQRLYIPSLGFCLLLGYGIERLSRIRTEPLNAARAFMAGVLLSAIIVVSYTGITMSRNLDWRDEVTLYSKALTENPDSVTMNNNLGNALTKKGRYVDAIRQFSIGLQLEPDSYLLHHNLGVALFETGSLKQAVEHYETALRLNPDYAEAWNNLGLAMAASGRLEAAVSHFMRAISLDPDHPKAHINLGVALVETGRVGEAIPHYETALRLDPDYAEGWNNLGLAMATTGRLAAAIRHFKTAISVDPNCSNAHHNLGVALKGFTPADPEDNQP